MSELIFITGVSGYIGIQTLILALEAGYTVRASIRKSSQITELSSHPRIQPFIKKLTFVIIPDLTNVEDLLENLKDVTGILHLASPLAIETQNYETDIISPALNITHSILQAASLTPSIKRLIITSSAVTLIPFSWLSSPNTLKLYSSSSLNTCTSPPYNSSMEAYWASKALSRHAVHDFLANDKNSHFDIVQLLPSVVIGPDILASQASDILKGTRALALAPLLGHDIPSPLVGAPVHVADVARAHIDSLSPKIPGNRDYILSSNAPDGIEWDGVLKIAEKEFGEAVEKGILKMGGSLGTTRFRLDTEETERVFGWKMTGFEETMRQLIQQYVELVRRDGEVSE